MENKTSGIAYLVEHTYLTNTGKVNGKSLRAYEVEYKINSNGWGVDKKPTGVMYSVKNGKIVKSKTSAKLKEKSVYAYNNGIVVYDSLSRLPNTWGCVLFSTPELGIIAKYQSIQNNINKAIKEQKETLSALDSSLADLKSQSNFLYEYPHLTI